MYVMPFNVLRHVNPRAAGRIVFGGGGGGGTDSTLATTTRAPAPAPTFKSSFGELSSVTYKSEADRSAAEAVVTSDKQKIADYRAAVNKVKGSTSTPTPTSSATKPVTNIFQSGLIGSALGFADGGSVDPNVVTANEGSAQINSGTAQIMDIQNRLTAVQSVPKPSVTYGQAEIDKIYNDAISSLTASLKGEQAKLGTLMKGSQQELMYKSMTDPTSLVKAANVGEIDTTGTEVAAGTGQLTGAAPTVDQTATIGTTATATAPAATPAATIEAAKVGDQAIAAANQVQAVQGTVSPDAIVEAAQGDTLQQLNLEAAQLAQAQTIKAPAERVLQEGELIQGSSVDMNKVNEAIQFEAAQANPSAMATVQGQLAQLTENFDAKSPPAWAAGALRAATAQMAARGLGASSMAGQALVQATLESALPIAMQDAQTVAQFESQNLSNRQQTAMFAAQQRAEFLGMEFTQDFQSRVANSARIGEIANVNFTAEQQIALENARMAQSVDLANLSAANGKVLADAAALTQLDLTNLNNRQQAAVQNAKSFLDMDMANLSAQQQTTMFKAQAIQQALFSDQAAENAARQFNASSENQTTQFFANLSSQVSQFNSSQVNATSQFNAGQTNAMAQFNANVKNQRDQFNAQNSLVVAQANAQWRQSVATTEFAAQHEANLDAAKTANLITTSALDQLWQRERDLMSFAWKSSESSMDRNLSILLADKDLDSVRMQLDAAEEAGKGAMAYDAFKDMFDW